MTFHRAEDVADAEAQENGILIERKTPSDAKGMAMECEAQENGNSIGRETPTSTDVKDMAMEMDEEEAGVIPWHMFHFHACLMDETSWRSSW